MDGNGAAAVQGRVDGPIAKHGESSFFFSGGKGTKVEWAGEGPWYILAGWWCFWVRGGR